MPIVIDRMLDLSTGHLTQETCNVYLKNDDECQVCADRTMCGWLVYVSDEYYDETALPKDLLDCILLARKYNCPYIKFDCDGTFTDELRFYVW